MAATAERTLTQRELNRAVLARQLLLERRSVPLTRALERIAGIQAQYAPSMYIGLWSRLDGLQREAVTRALEQRTVVQGTLMRSTIHLVSAGDFWPFLAGIRRRRREHWLRVARDAPSAAEYAEAAGRLRAGLREGPLRRSEIEELLGKRLTSGLGLWIDLVRVPPSGTWERRRADLFAAADDWLPAQEVSEGDGIELLVRRYLTAFGPAPRRDIADWAGLPIKTVAPALERLPLRRFRTEDGGELLDLPRLPLPDADSTAPVRFLPVWDATLLVHARRTGILPERYRPRIFNTRTPHSANTFLVDGAVAGTWRYDDERIAIEPFEKLDKSVEREIADEAERLAAFHA